MTDGLHVTWGHDTNTCEKLTNAIRGEVSMLVTGVSLCRGGSDDVIYVGSTQGAGTENSITLDQWVEMIILNVHSMQKGVKIILDAAEVVEPVLQLLQSKRDRIFTPIWLHADVLPGPGGTNSPQIDFANFIDVVERCFPQATLSLGWTAGGCDEGYTNAMMDQMWEYCRDITQATTIVARAHLLKNSWPLFRCLLDKSDRLTLTVTDWEYPRPLQRKCVFLSYDLLLIRNDFDKSRAYYDLHPGPDLEEFKILSVSAGSPLHVYDVGMDAAKVTWAHAVNSQAKLIEALQDETILMLEADVLLRGQDTPNQTMTPVMAHPPTFDSDITLEQWLDGVILTNKGIKLDFKNLDALSPALSLLNERKTQIRQPIWLNADIMQGHNSAGYPLDATKFLGVVNSTFPEATLSLGWETGWSNSDKDEGYSEAMVQEAHQLCEGLRQPVTFPVRAAAVKRSWCNLQWLLDQSRRYTLTIWTSAVDIVDREDMYNVWRQSEHSRIYFDLPKNLMPDV